MAKGLAEAGAHVVLAGRKEERLRTLSEELLIEGLKASVVVVDVRDGESIKRAFTRVAEEHGRLHVLVNNAYEGAGGTMETSSAESFARAYEVAVIGAFRCIVAAKPLLRAAVLETGHASIINIASMYGIVSPDLRIYDSPEDSNPPSMVQPKLDSYNSHDMLRASMQKKGFASTPSARARFPIQRSLVSTQDFISSCARRHL